MVSLFFLFSLFMALYVAVGERLIVSLFTNVSLLKKEIFDRIDFFNPFF